MNDVKVKNLSNAAVCELADDQTVQEIAGASCRVRWTGRGLEEKSESVGGSGCDESE